jgi:hypothetical protein
MPELPMARTGDKASEVFIKSKLHVDKLSQIWSVALCSHDRVLLTVVRPHVGTWQTRRTGALWTRPISALRCTSSKPPCRDNSPLSQLVFLLASTIRPPGSLTQLHPTRLVAVYSRVLPQAVSQAAPFSRSTRAGCNLSSLVEDLRQIFLLGLLRFRE